MGWFLGDTVLTGEEYRGLMDNLLVSKDPPTGATKLSDWLAENYDTVGRAYASEVKRHF